MAYYNWLSFFTARQQLAQRLSDPDMVFWQDAELKIYLQQALRMFNSLTYTWKADFNYTNTACVWNSLATKPGSPRLRSLTDTDAYVQMEYMLLEPPTEGLWTGTSQFDISDLAQALQRRRDEMLKVSNCNQSLKTGIPLTPNTRRTTLEDTVIDVARVRYIPAVEQEATSNLRRMGALMKAGNTIDPPPVPSLVQVETYSASLPGSLTFGQATRTGNLIISFESGPQHSVIQGKSYPGDGGNWFGLPSDDDYDFSGILDAPPATTVSGFQQDAGGGDINVACGMIAEFAGRYLFGETGWASGGEAASVQISSPNTLVVAAAKCYNDIGGLISGSAAGWNELLVADYGAVVWKIAQPGTVEFVWPSLAGKADLQTSIGTFPIIGGGGGFETIYLGGIAPSGIFVGIGVSFTLTVTGTGFVGDSVVTIDGTAYPTIYDSSTKLRAIVPDDFAAGSVLPGQSSTFPVRVTSPDQSSSNALTLTVTACATGITLYRDDTVAQEWYESPLYQQPSGTPQTFMLTSEPPLSFDVDIPPAQPGTYEAVVCKSGEPFTPPASTLLNIPDDFTWVLIWGALSDLLGRESEATDRQRAGYCLKRYMDGMNLFLKSPWIMLAKVNGVAVTTDSIYAADRYTPEWDSSPSTFGPFVVTGGMDFIAAPVGSSVGLTVLGNAPIPILDDDPVQVSRDNWDTVLDLAQVMACFKMGGYEFQNVLEIEARAIQACAAENTRLKSTGAFADVLAERGQAQDRDQERFATARAQQGNG